jgi:hypothetical protein
MVSNREAMAARCGGLIEAHGGALEFAVRPDRGSCAATIENGFVKSEAVLIQDDGRHRRADLDNDLCAAGEGEFAGIGDESEIVADGFDFGGEPFGLGGKRGIRDENHRHEGRGDK